MRKLSNFFLLCATVAIAACTTSCGNGYSASACISSAEETYPVTESPLLDKLPAYAKQYAKAKSVSYKLYDNQYDKYTGDKSMDNDDRNDKLADLREKRKEVDKEIDEHYLGKMNSIIEDLEGKDVPCIFEEAAFTDIKAKISNIKITDSGYYTVELDVTATPAGTPNGRSDEYFALANDINGETVFLEVQKFRNVIDMVPCRADFGLDADVKEQTFSAVLFGNLAYDSMASIHFGKNEY